MSSEVLIRLASASKTYPLQRQPGAELAARLLGRTAPTAHRHALHPVDLEVRRGEAVGIVGLNGAGKSTLLQLAAGVLSPSAGQVHIKGRVAALLELGSAFDLEASGWDNIALYAATLGVSAAEIERRREGIIDFSGLRDFIQAPVKSYSTGMQVRRLDHRRSPLRGRRRVRQTVLRPHHGTAAEGRSLAAVFACVVPCGPLLCQHPVAAPGSGTRLGPYRAGPAPLPRVSRSAIRAWCGAEYRRHPIIHNIACP